MKKLYTKRTCIYQALLEYNKIEPLKTKGLEDCTKFDKIREMKYNSNESAKEEVMYEKESKNF